MKKTFKSLLLVLALGTSFSVVGVSNVIGGGTKAPAVVNAAETISIKDSDFMNSKVLTNLVFSYTKTVEGGVTTYSDFKNIQLQFKIEFDFSKISDIDGFGILVTDDKSFNFETENGTGAYDDYDNKLEDWIKGKFIKFEAPSTNYTKYIVGIDFDELTIDVALTDFYAGVYYKNEYGYHFAHNGVKKVCLVDLVGDYLKLTTLTSEQSAILKDLQNYMDTL